MHSKADTGQFRRNTIQAC